MDSELNSESNSESNSELNSELIVPATLSNESLDTQYEDEIEFIFNTHVLIKDEIELVGTSNIGLAANYIPNFSMDGLPKYYTIFVKRDSLKEFEEYIDLHLLIMCTNNRGLIIDTAHDFKVMKEYSFYYPKKPYRYNKTKYDSQLKHIAIYIDYVWINPAFSMKFAIYNINITHGMIRAYNRIVENGTTKQIEPQIIFPNQFIKHSLHQNISYYPHDTQPKILQDIYGFTYKEAPHAYLHSSRFYNPRTIQYFNGGSMSKKQVSMLENSFYKENSPTYWIRKFRIIIYVKLFIHRCSRKLSKH